MSKTRQGFRVKSREELNWLMDHLLIETHRAWDHWDLLVGLETAIQDYGEEMRRAAQFWKLTKRAHHESVILRLSRLFDPVKEALSLCNMLQTIRVDAINPAGYLGPDAPGLDLATLEVELGTVSESDPRVSRLLAVRNEYLAHRASRLVRSGSFSALPELDQEDVETLLKRASQIGDKYTQLYGRTKVARWYPGADDYKQMFHLLKLGLQSVGGSG